MMMKGLILPPDRAANMQQSGQSNMGCDVAMLAGEEGRRRVAVYCLLL
jgi:hypothetical protein